MIYRFQSRATGNVLMTGEGGEQVLRAMGLVPSPHGVIEPQDMAAAIDTIEAAIRRDDEARELTSSTDRRPSTDSEEGAPTLRQRAWPIVEMLKQAQTAGKAIVWGL